MSNQSANGYGLIPVKHRDGREYVGGNNIPMYIPSSNGTQLFIGDAVTMTGSNNTTPILAKNQVGGAVGFDPGALPTVAKTASGSNPVTGVITHIGYDPTNTFRPPSVLANQEAVIWVCTDPSVVYRTKVLNGSSGNGTLTSGTNVGGATANIYAGTGDNNTGRSGTGLDSSAIHTSTTTTDQLRILGIARDLLNSDLTSANPDVLVVLNNTTETTVAVPAL